MRGGVTMVSPCRKRWIRLLSMGAGEGSWRGRKNAHFHGRAFWPERTMWAAKGWKGKVCITRTLRWLVQCGKLLMEWLISHWKRPQISGQGVWAYSIDSGTSFILNNVILWVKTSSLLVLIKPKRGETCWRQFQWPFQSFSEWQTLQQGNEFKKVLSWIGRVGTSSHYEERVRHVCLV